MKRFVPVTSVQEQASTTGNGRETVKRKRSIPVTPVEEQAPSAGGSRQRTLSKTLIQEECKENNTNRQAPLKALSQREMDALFQPESSDEDSDSGSIAPLEAVSQEDLFFQPESDSSSSDTEVLPVKKDREALRLQKQKQEEIEYSLRLEKRKTDFYDHSSNIEFHGEDFAEIGKKHFQQLMKKGAQKKQAEEKGQKKRVVTVFYYEKGKKVSTGSLGLHSFCTYNGFFEAFKKRYPNQNFLLSYSHPDGPENQLYTLSTAEWESFYPSIIYVRIM